MKCKFCDRKAHARGLCGTHYGYARRYEAGHSPADFNPRLKSADTTKLEGMTDIKAGEMVKLFSEEFIQLRNEKDISKNALATKSGLTRKTIYRVEHEYRNMRMSTFLATLGTIPFGPELLHRLADQLQAIQDAQGKR